MFFIVPAAAAAENDDTRSDLAGHQKFDIHSFLKLCLFRFRMGAYKRTDIAQELEVDQIIMHEDYTPATYDYDIALLKLKTQATLGAGVGLVCLPELRFNPVRKACYITGWGRTSDGGSQPIYLQEASVPIISTAKCRLLYSILKFIPDSMICAGYRAGGVDFCHGDDGGPLVCEFDGKWYLEGVTGWRSGCGERKRPGVYAKVRYLKEWIKNKISRN